MDYLHWDSQWRPAVHLRVSDTFSDSIRQQVLTKMFECVERNRDGRHGVEYRFSKADYDYILRDNVTGSWTCSCRTARRWYKAALEGTWKAKTRGGAYTASFRKLRMTDELKRTLYHIVLQKPFATGKKCAELLFEASGQRFHSSYVNKMLKEMKLTVKKVTYEKKKKFTVENIKYYESWVELYKTIDRRRLIFCDHTGFNRTSFHQKKAVPRLVQDALVMNK